MDNKQIPTNASRYSSDNPSDYVKVSEFELYKNYSEKQIDEIKHTSEHLNARTEKLSEDTAQISAKIDRIDSTLTSFIGNFDDRISLMIENINLKVNGKLDNITEHVTTLEKKSKEHDAKLNNISDTVDKHDNKLTSKTSNLSFWAIVIPAVFTFIYQMFNIIMSK